MCAELIAAARFVYPYRLAVATLFLSLVCAHSADAVPINYGNFVGSTVTFQMVQEDSGTDATPLFGAPSIGGDLLHFGSMTFNSASSNGAVPDMTDGQLTFAVESNNKQTQAIPFLKITEVGDTTMTGNVPPGSVATSTSVDLAVFVDIFEVDGVALPAPIKLSGMSTPPLPVLTPMYSQLPGNTPSDGAWQLGVDGGGGPSFTTQWGGMMLIDLRDALVKSGTPFVRGATRLTVNLDNVLVATSVDGATATIAKRAFTISSIPEPSTSLLLMLALVTGLMARVR
jgi:hypothetical protein